MNIHNRIKKFTDEFKDTISDEEIFATNKINRYIGEVGIAEGFSNLMVNKQKLTIQDYEFYSNIPAIVNLISNKSTKFLVNNISDSTAHWAINLSLTMKLRNLNVALSNDCGKVNITPTSELALNLYTEITSKIYAGSGFENDLRRIITVNALDSIAWNKVLEDCRNVEQHLKPIIIARDFNKSGVIEEQSVLTMSGLDCLQSISGWCLLVPAFNLN